MTANHVNGAERREAERLVARPRLYSPVQRRLLLGVADAIEASGGARSDLDTRIVQQAYRFRVWPSSDEAPVRPTIPAPLAEELDAATRSLAEPLVALRAAERAYLISLGAWHRAEMELGGKVWVDRAAEQAESRRMARLIQEVDATRGVLEDARAALAVGSRRVRRSEEAIDRWRRQAVLQAQEQARQVERKKGHS